ncbi:hypothetical protein TWF694_003526 [Orbilia ellipsospora]|uniref:Uncharacterized protein n=1 Tax=Orbilia ellipsospora TaxID=2528407 RepID=A0AAV9WZH5_9PEZI
MSTSTSSTGLSSSSGSSSSESTSSESTSYPLASLLSKVELTSIPANLLLVSSETPTSSPTSTSAPVSTSTTSTISYSPGPSFAIEGSGQYAGYFTEFDPITGAIIMAPIPAGQIEKPSLNIDSGGYLRSNQNSSILVYLRTPAKSKTKRQAMTASRGHCELCQVMHGTQADITSQDIVNTWFFDGSETKLTFSGHLYQFYVSQADSKGASFVYMVSNAMTSIPAESGLNLQRLDVNVVQSVTTIPSTTSTATASAAAITTSNQVVTASITSTTSTTSTTSMSTSASASIRYSSSSRPSSSSSSSSGSKSTAVSTSIHLQHQPAVIISTLISTSVEISFVHSNSSHHGLTPSSTTSLHSSFHTLLLTNTSVIANFSTTTHLSIEPTLESLPIEHDAYDIITSYGYYEYCSSLLASTFTTHLTSTFSDPAETIQSTTTILFVIPMPIPTTTVYQTKGSTSTATSVTNIFSARAVAKVYGFSGNMDKGDFQDRQHPDHLATYQPDQVTSGCSRAVGEVTVTEYEISTTTVPITTSISTSISRSIHGLPFGATTTTVPEIIPYPGIGAITPVDPNYPGLLLRDLYYCRSSTNCNFPYTGGALVACETSEINYPTTNWYVMFDTTTTSWFVMRGADATGSVVWSIPAVYDTTDIWSFRVTTDVTYGEFSNGKALHTDNSGHKTLYNLTYVTYDPSNGNHYISPDLSVMQPGHLWTCVFWLDPEIKYPVKGTKGFRGLFYVPSTVDTGTFQALGRGCEKIPNNMLQMVHYKDPNVLALDRRDIPKPTTFNYKVKGGY